ncbi:hypothetical protein [Hamadaea tsunoensis]|uniref:hypothetical protein n=1 Tax=Hamadaea tsunoensis TaxID=53368 RepID=UPI0003FBA559|nr:hypothetical protein [Hamadaea tsunoensis]
MSAYVNAALPVISLFVWPIVKSLVFLAAATISVYSRKENRRSAARRLMQIINRDSDSADD